VYGRTLLVGAEVADKAQLSVRHLPDQGAATLREGRLDHQRFGGLRCNVRVVGVRRVQNPLRVELTQPTEQVIGAPLQRE
jgi:hypothetical protein